MIIKTIPVKESTVRQNKSILPKKVTKSVHCSQIYLNMECHKSMVDLQIAKQTSKDYAKLNSKPTQHEFTIRHIPVVTKIHHLIGA